MQIFSLSIAEIYALPQSKELIKNLKLLYENWYKANFIKEAVVTFLDELPLESRFWVLANNDDWHWLIAWQPLTFDSQVFGFSLGRLCLLVHRQQWPQAQACKQGQELLHDLLIEAWREGIKGLWARVPVQDLVSIHVLEEAGFKLYASSVEWEIDLRILSNFSPDLAVKVRPWQEIDRDLILDLASQAFCQCENYADRFALDPRLRDSCPVFYRHWMANSLSGEQADQVLVLEYSGLAQGFITLKKASNIFGTERSCGWVVLNAISPILRGKGYYYSLLWAGLDWLRIQGVERARVRTKANQWAVIRSWAQLGARPVGADLTFHYWM